jgi:hypothetical protein
MKIEFVKNIRTWALPFAMCYVDYDNSFEIYFLIFCIRIYGKEQP